MEDAKQNPGAALTLRAAAPIPIITLQDAIALATSYAMAHVLGAQNPPEGMMALTLIREVGIVRAGTRFALSTPSLPGQTFQGTVVAASDFIDPLTRTIKIRGVVPNADRRLKAEMLATAKFIRSFSSGVVVPSVSVLLRGSRQAIFVQTKPGEFERRVVDLDYEGPNEVIVSQGVAPGELVVSENALLLARLLRLAEEEARAPDLPTQPAAANGSKKASAK
jgi:cobalt-zinc-cadmium efflux system membrane fusion protein